MHRPGPLQDLPLVQFLPPDPNLPDPFKSPPNKRPLSPGGPSLLSPAKRRILDEEDFFSPEKALKNPISRSSWDSSARFAQVLSGPQSPVKILNFGTPKHRTDKRPSATRGTPSRPSTTNDRFTPSLDFEPVPQPLINRPDYDLEVDDYFGRPSSSSMPPPPPSIPASNSQSIHYPGFRVYCDVPSSSIPFEGDLYLFNTEDDAEEDNPKENIAPRRKLRKALIAGANLLLSTPDVKPQETEKLAKIKPTPKRIFGMEKPQLPNSPTLRKPVLGVMDLEGMSTPKGRKEMRKWMQEEGETA